MPNAFASLMLMLWPVVAWRLFVALPPGRALIWTFLGAYLLLPPPPAAFDFPLMPALDKETLPNLSAFVIVVVVLGLKPRILPESRPARWLVLAVILSPIATVFTNSEPLIFTERVIRGLYLQDAIAQPINQFITLMGFLLARNYLRTREDQRALLVVNAGNRQARWEDKRAVVAVADLEVSVVTIQVSATVMQEQQFIAIRIPYQMIHIRIEPEHANLALRVREHGHGIEG